MIGIGYRYISIVQRDLIKKIGIFYFVILKEHVKICKNIFDVTMYYWKKRKNNRLCSSNIGISSCFLFQMENIPCFLPENGTYFI